MSAPSSARTLPVDALGDRPRATPVVGELDAVVLDALAQDGQARGEVGRLDVGDEAGLEALAQPVLERVQVARQAVAVRTSWLPASCSALKVWKNSSSVLRLALRGTGRRR